MNNSEKKTIEALIRRLADWRRFHPDPPDPYLGWTVIPEVNPKIDLWDEVPPESATIVGDRFSE